MVTSDNVKATELAEWIIFAVKTFSNKRYSSAIAAVLTRIKAQARKRNDGHLD